MTSGLYFCPDCGRILVWDSDGSQSTLGEACWFCTFCGNIIPPNDEYPPPATNA